MDKLAGKSAKKVQLRGGFGDRNKLQEINTTMQLNTLDDRIRVVIANILKEWIYSHNFEPHVFRFLKDLIQEVYCEYISSTLEYNIKYVPDKIFTEYISNTILVGEYGDVLTLFEYVVRYFVDRNIEQLGRHGYFVYYDYEKAANEIFEREYVGYRFICGIITPITDTIECEEIKQACGSKFQGSSTHIKNALGFLSDREHKDYKNCIKESISAVESACKIIIEKENATLGDALKVLESKHGLKGQLKSAFEKLYNYTNDKGGIRHADGLFESEVSFEEARFMLVSCSAFVNYLIAEYGKIK